MTDTSVSISLVERRSYNNKDAHNIAEGVWWTGYADEDNGRAYNTFLLIDNQEAVLINPGSRNEKTHKAIKSKITSKINLKQIRHIIISHSDPDISAAAPLFEKTADRNVQVYTPAEMAESVHHYGGRNPIIGLRNGDSVILKSGRTIDFHETPQMGKIGPGFFYDSYTGTVFVGNIFGCFQPPWNLFAPHKGYENITPCYEDSKISRKSLIQAINKIEKLSPRRVCLQNGPIIEDDIDQYFNAVRRLGE